jgi:hypothetical protein
MGNMIATLEQNGLAPSRSGREETHSELETKVGTYRPPKIDPAIYAVPLATAESLWKVHVANLDVLDGKADALFKAVAGLAVLTGAGAKFVTVSQGSFLLAASGVALLFLAAVIALLSRQASTFATPITAWDLLKYADHSGAYPAHISAFMAARYGLAADGVERTCRRKGRLVNVASWVFLLGLALLITASLYSVPRT